MIKRPVLFTCALLAAALPAAAQDPVVRVDSVFRQWTGDATPGCAVGVSRAGRMVLSRAYGMSDLEHEIRNSPNTIFEAGSVSKQFTAAAIMLLVLDGKLALEDDIRKYVPEIPDYGTPIRIRHMLNHTSGLRDWGSVAGIAGWGRSERTHTHAHVVDILSRQRALNFTPGAQYSYSNSGYNLLAVVVDRVSGMSFAEFSRTRIFEPLGMKNTQWRDDYTRIVKGRSAAYAARGNTFAIDRPIEDVHGNGGLLTTVGDLLLWNDAIGSGRLGGQRLTDLMVQQGVLNNGQTITYAAGLQVGQYNGVREISHTGSTSGYRAFLARYPEQQVGVAVLCNVGNVNPGTVGHRVADIVLGDAARPRVTTANQNAQQNNPAPRPAAWTPTAAQLGAYAGEYYSPDAETTFVVSVQNGGLTLFRRPAARMVLTPAGEDQFTTSLGRIRFVRDASGAVRQLSVQQDRVFDLRFDRVPTAR
jgi:CubicO group peptidase (beta-lactamase class C family)